MWSVKFVQYYSVRLQVLYYTLVIIQKHSLDKGSSFSFAKLSHVYIEAQSLHINLHLSPVTNQKMLKAVKVK